ncbi:hypothetical protein C8R41DRAFT_926164 [Lentinula lateritia]|uniref:Uncharacterized protein n=1 Tax=Lentinula lateritia TaxID=40482 RepID=A0ABQ8UYX2_9AGAR|nr:hypothetical protein C8R41DRAFT_926164 [Lentinula lateritia]
MDAQPRFTRAWARATRPKDNDPAPRQVPSLCQSILGPPPVSVDGDPAPADAVTDLPATLPPTQSQPFVQPAWILPHPHGKDADPVNSDDKWFGVAASELYEPHNAYATSGEEGSKHHIHSRLRSGFSSLGDNDFHHVPPPAELSHSVALEDFVELPPRTASMVPINRRIYAPSCGPFRDPALAPVLDVSNNGLSLQPAPIIHVHNRAPAVQRGRGSEHTRQLRTRAHTQEPSSGPDFGVHLRRIHDHPSDNPYTMYLSSYAQNLRATEQRVPVKNGRRFQDPCQGEISSSAPAAMLNQVNPLVVSALCLGWPMFISLNYISRRMSEVGKSSVSAAGETWDIDKAGQVKFKTKRLKELSFESIS